MPKSIEVEIVPLSSLAPDPDNANEGTERGNEMLARSLRERGAARSAVATADGVILAGNKTHQAAIESGFSEAVLVHTTGDRLVVVVRDDLQQGDEAASILALEDNRIGQVSLKFSEGVLARLAKEKPEVVSELWSDQELAKLLEPEEIEEESLDDIDPSLPGAMSLKADMTFESDLPWDIPALLPDMLAQPPPVLDTWAGPDVCTDDEITNWLYNWSSDSTRGLPFDRTILAFYVQDRLFENFWFQPDVYVSKVLNAGITVSIAPNFSLWFGSARATHLYNIFRSRWVARYMQEAGVKIIPDLNWSDQRSFEFCLIGIPKYPPVVAVQLQTINRNDEAEMERAAEGLRTAVDSVCPEHLIIYGGNTASKIVEGSGVDCGMTMVENRVAKRRSLMDRRKNSMEVMK